MRGGGERKPYQCFERVSENKREKTPLWYLYTTTKREREIELSLARELEK